MPASSTVRDSVRGGDAALRELEPVDAAGHHDRDVLVAGDDVQADRREDHRHERRRRRLRGLDDRLDQPPEEPGALDDRREARAPSTSQIVDSIDDMPPRENSESIVSLPVWLTNPLAIAM